MAALPAGAEGPLGLRSVGAGTTSQVAGRAWGVVLSWDELSPSKAEVDWARADALLLPLDLAGFDIVPVLAPRHRESRRTDLANAYLKDLNAGAPPHDWLSPDDLASWVAFVRAAVERYGANAPPEKRPLSRPIRAWQLCEEFPASWWGGDDAFIGFARASARAIRETDPLARVVFPALSSENLALFAFLDGAITVDTCVLEGGRCTRYAIRKNLRIADEKRRYLEVVRRVGSEVDFMDVHLVLRIEYVAPCVSWMRERLSELGVGTEIVCSRASGPLDKAGEERTPETVRRRLAILPAIAMAEGVTHVAWDWAALADTEGALNRWKRLQSLLDDCVKAEFTSRGAVQGVRFTKKDGWVGFCWSEVTSDAIWIDTGESIRCLSIDGVEIEPPSRCDEGWKVHAGPDPIFLLPE